VHLRQDPLKPCTNLLALTLSVRGATARRERRLIEIAHEIDEMFAFHPQVHELSIVRHQLLSETPDACL